MKSKAALIILDGWGIAPPGPGNAVLNAETPYMDKLFASYPHNKLYCYGPYVGLPEGQMGNSEVGHLNLGAGRIIHQDITRINLAIKDGSFAKNPSFLNAAGAVRQHNATLHLMGLIGPGGVHAVEEHLNALIEMAVAQKLNRVAIHAFLDGRDTPPDSAAGYIAKLLQFIKPYPQVVLASLSGRYYAMDRDNRWDRVEKVWQAIALGQGIKITDPIKAINAAYQEKEFDEFIKPRVITNAEGTPLASIKDNDAVIFFNFRSDRARELSRAFSDAGFNGFDVSKAPKLSVFVTMTQYDDQLKVQIAFPPESITNTLAEVISQDGLRQLHIAETEKYAHVTFFFNGGVEEPVKGEDRALIASPKDVSTYDQKPAMSAVEITDELLRRIASNQYDFILVNYANCDMVGHTGVLIAAIEAVEVLDKCLSRLIPELMENGFKVLLTADHGNAEQMLDKNNRPYTAHTVCNPVPLLLAAGDADLYNINQGALCDVAPTILDIMGLQAPPEMTGKSLLETR